MNVLGLVRLFGNGRVAVHKQTPAAGWRDFETMLSAAQTAELVRSVGGTAVRVCVDERLQRAVGTRDRSLQGLTRLGQSWASVQVRLHSYRPLQGPPERFFRCTPREGHWQPEGVDGARKRAPEPGSLAAALQQLYGLTDHADLARVDDAGRDPDFDLLRIDTDRPAAASTELLYLNSKPPAIEILETDRWGSEARRLADLPDLRIERWALRKKRVEVAADGTRAIVQSLGGTYLLDLACGDRRRILEEATEVFVPRFSPSGDMIVASASIGGRHRCLVGLDGDGSNLRFLSELAAIPLQWSPDGRLIYYHGARLVRHLGRERPLVRSFLVLDRHGGERRRLLPIADANVRQLLVAPRGDMALFSWTSMQDAAGYRRSGLYAVALNPRSGESGPWALPRRVLPYATDLDWSPDSRWLVFTTGRRLGIVGADGQRQRTLIEVEVGDRRPVQPNWSPDGRKIAFVMESIADGWIPRGEPELWIIGAGGIGSRRLAETTPPLWSSDN